MASFLLSFDKTVSTARGARRRCGAGSVAGIAVAAALLTLSAAPASAQFTIFGKNKVQYMNFDWHVLHSEHFDIYFYPEEEELARRSMSWAEESYDTLAGTFGHEVTRRIPLIIYNSHQAFAQTNVTPFFLPEGVAGLTEFIKGRVLMPFNGSYHQFRTTLHHEIVHVFQLSITSNVHRRYFRQSVAHTPQWLTEGLADYLSEPWDAIGEMLMSDLVVEGNLPDIEGLWRVRGFPIYKLGQHLIGFLVETYGEGVIGRIYENLWVSQEFRGVLEWVTGDPIDEINARWHQYAREHFYPTVVEREPIALVSRPLTRRGADFKPIEVPEGVLGDGEKFIFVSPRSGYTNIYSASLAGPEEDVETLVRGEREAALESLHPFVSKVDINDEGLLAFVSKWHDKDAVVLFDVERREIVARYQFPHLLALTSPAWSPDGRRIAFQGVSDAAYSDLYVLDLDTGEHRRLTHDLYQDLDPDFLPDGETIVFASDRTEYGEEGGKNLFLIDVETTEIRYLTRGPWVDAAPRVTPEGDHVVFTSTRDGLPDIYEVDLDGRGRRLTHFLTGAIDPSPMRDGKHLLFTGYSRGRYNVRMMELPPRDPEEPFAFTLEEMPGRPGWWWPDPGEHGKAEAARYTRSFGLDFAAGGVAFDPGQTDAQGAQLVFTDMLGDELISASIGNTAQRGDNFIKRLNLGVSYLNLRRRLNYGIGVYHFAGDFLDERDFTFFERRAGASLIMSYPFSKFRRVETSVGFAYSDKRNPATQIDRRTYLATNYVSWVHDNSLWLPTGPIDGARIKATAGLTLDIPRGEVEGVQLIGDYRRYLRASQRSAFATRVRGLLSWGSDPRFWTLGGTHTLRGYPRRELFGTRALLWNNEYRFPLISGFLIGFPFGAIEFPGIQGAVFADAGWLWNENEEMPWPPLGSLGVSFRMAFGGFLVFRFDLARRTDFERIEKRTRTDFFIGWNY